VIEKNKEDFQRVIKQIMEKRREQRLASANRLKAFHKLKMRYKANKELYDSLVRQGKLLPKEEKKRKISEIKEIIGDDKLGWKFHNYEARSANMYKRSDFNYIPAKLLAKKLDLSLIYPVCRCGEADIYIQPPWTGQIDGPHLDYWLWGDNQGHIYNWDDAPPDFEWKVQPQAGQVTTASAHMDMDVTGGDDGWNQSWAWLWTYASWLPTNPGQFKAHVHFGGSDGPTNAGTVGDGYEPWPWDDEAYFGAWVYLWVFYYDNGNLVTLGNTGWSNIVSHYERGDYTALGTCPWYWKLDDWVALGEYSIPVDKRVYLVMGIEFETSAGSDDECNSGVFFNQGRELLIRPVITGTQCTRI